MDSQGRTIEREGFHFSGRGLACALVCVATWLCPPAAGAATITVNSTSDAAADDGACTLREAITAANTNTASGVMAGECGAGAAGLDAIVFNIPGAGVKTITTALPTITIASGEPVAIDGYTQTGASANTNPLSAGINAVLTIEINGDTGGGLNVNASGSSIRGLNIHGGGDEITINASNVTIAGNFLGTNPAGTAEGSAGGFGIRLVTGDDNVFGGPAAADRNLIAGDKQGGIALNAGNRTLVQGNYIGTDVTGTLPINDIGSREGVRGSPDSATSIIGNLISSNSDGGVHLGPFSTEPGGGFIQGNLIGTQRDGISPLGNNFGVAVGGRTVGSGYLIGGTGAGEGNIIAFNTTFGVIIQTNSVEHGILGNSIFGNGTAGISSAFGTPHANDACDPDTVPGDLGQNYPTITSAAIAAGNVTISGTLDSTASTTFRVEFFSNVSASPSGNGEGQTFLGFANVTTDALCDGSFGPLVFPVPSGQTVFAATATDPANNTSEFSVAFTAAAAASADLSVTKSASPNPVAAGGNLTYTLGVANGGPSAAASVSLTDMLPANTTFVSFAAPGGWATMTPAVGGTGTVTATNGSLASGGTANFTLVVKVDAGALDGTIISNTASVASATTDPNGNDNAASASATVSATGPPPPAAIPTLSPWALAALALLLAAVGAIGVGRRRA